MVDFPDNFGKALSIPVAAAELQSLPEKYDLENMAYYHAGMNPVANIVMLSWQNVLNKLLPLSSGISIFRWAIINFTSQPYGGTIRTVVENGHLRKKVVVSHNKLYEATAIPVVATSRLLLENQSKDYGYYFMGEWVDQNLFVQYAKELGLEIKFKNTVFDTK